MTQTKQTLKPASTRGFKILLGISLAVNLAVTGLVAGAFVRKGPGGPMGGNAQVNYARSYIQALPKEQRREVVEALRHSKHGGSRVERRAHHADVVEILRADVFDRPAIEAVLALQIASTLDAQSAGQERWLNIIEKMSIEERRAYVDGIENALKRGTKRKPKQKQSN
jgi:uncharacterized membrane protein